MIMRLLHGTGARLLGLADRGVAPEGLQMAAAAVGSASTRLGMAAWLSLPAPMLHCGGRALPPPPLKMGGIGLSVPLPGRQPSALLSLVRTAHPVPDNRTWRTRTKTSRSRGQALASPHFWSRKNR